MTTPNDTLPAAGFWRRVGAKFCDWALIFAAQLLALGLLGVLDAVMGWQPVSVTMGSFALFLVLQVVYFGVGNAKGRRTPGYRWAGLQLEKRQGGPLSTARSLWRAFLSMSASTLLLYGGFLNFLPALFGRGKRSGHDLASDSRVICTDKPRLVALWGVPALLFVFMGLWLSRVIYPVPLHVFFIPSGAMEPTLNVDDRMMVNLLAYRARAPRRGEIAVFKAPAAALFSGDPRADVDFVKRVVGVPGQRVEMVKGRLRVEGAWVSEPYAQWKTGALGLPNVGAPGLHYDMKIVDGTIYSREQIGAGEWGRWTQNGVAASEKDQRRILVAQAGRVPPNHFLMLGDHRSNSNDSHVWGFVPHSAFVGRVMNVFWPLSHWKTLR